MQVLRPVTRCEEQTPQMPEGAWPPRPCPPRDHTPTPPHLLLEHFHLYSQLLVAALLLGLAHSVLRRRRTLDFQGLLESLRRKKSALLISELRDVTVSITVTVISKAPPGWHFLFNATFVMGWLSSFWFPSIYVLFSRTSLFSVMMLTLLNSQCCSRGCTAGAPLPGQPQRDTTAVPTL